MSMTDEHRVNELNSSIIEGKVVNCECDDKRVNFTMENMRTYIDIYGERHEERHFFPIEVYGKLAEFAKDIKSGDKVRVVGRLKSSYFSWSSSSSYSPTPRITIVAEHIEHKKG